MSGMDRTPPLLRYVPHNLTHASCSLRFEAPCARWHVLTASCEKLRVWSVVNIISSEVPGIESGADSSFERRDGCAVVTSDVNCVMNVRAANMFPSKR